MRIKENSWLAFVGAVCLHSKKMALVFDHTIYLWKASREEFLLKESWVCHELTHVQQYHEYGTLKFLSIYFLEFIKHGYQNNRLEKEARENERNAGFIERFTFK